MPSIALDIDGTVLAFPEFFKLFVSAMQKEGCQVGILTAEPQSNSQQLSRELEDIGIKPDFFILKPDDSKQTDGEFKADVCNSLNIDYLFDDLESDDPEMMGDFFSRNEKTSVFTGFAYKP